MAILLKVYIVRHGETTSNKDGTIQGHLDTALNEEGLRQATLLAQRLKSNPIHIAYTSDLQRAKEVRFSEFLHSHQAALIPVLLVPDSRSHFKAPPRGFPS